MFSELAVCLFFRWIVLSCESGMHIASFQDGTSPLSDLEYAKGKKNTFFFEVKKNSNLMQQ